MSYMAIWGRIEFFCFRILFDVYNFSCRCLSFFFFSQKTPYEMRIIDGSSDVCSSDLPLVDIGETIAAREQHAALMDDGDARARDLARRDLLRHHAIDEIGEAREPFGRDGIGGVRLRLGDDRGRKRCATEQRGGKGVIPNRASGHEGTSLPGSNKSRTRRLRDGPKGNVNPR